MKKSSPTSNINSVVEPWDAKSDTSKSNEPWSYSDYLYWKKGNLYKAIVEIPACTILPEKEKYSNDQTIFVVKTTKLQEEYKLSEQQIQELTKAIKPNELFMLVDEHYDGAIFSVLHDQQVRYISREFINMYNAVQAFHGE